MRKHFDFWSILVIALTLILFVVALVIKGFTHDLLLEAGVFLVSVKLILMSHKNSILAIETEDRLEQIHALLRNMQTEPRARECISSFVLPAALRDGRHARAGHHR